MFQKLKTWLVKVKEIVTRILIIIQNWFIKIGIIIRKFLKVKKLEFEEDESDSNLLPTYTVDNHGSMEEDVQKLNIVVINDSILDILLHTSERFSQISKEIVEYADSPNYDYYSSLIKEQGNFVYILRESKYLPYAALHQLILSNDNGIDPDIRVKFWYIRGDVDKYDDHYYLTVYFNDSVVMGVSAHPECFDALQPWHVPTDGSVDLSWFDADWIIDMLLFMLRCDSLASEV